MCAAFREDGVISDLEAGALHIWMNAHSAVMNEMGLGALPKRVGAILADFRVTEDERAELLAMVEAITTAAEERPGADEGNGPFAFDEPAELPGPESGAIVVTGLFLSGARKKVESQLAAEGWSVEPRVTGRCAVVLVGSVPSPGWKRGDYGKKIAEVLKLKRSTPKAAPLLISESHWQKLRAGDQ